MNAPLDTPRGHIANALMALQCTEQVEAERLVYPSHVVGAVRAHLEQALGQLDGVEPIPEPIHLRAIILPGDGSPEPFLSDFAERTSLGPTVDPIPPVGLG